MSLPIGKPKLPVAVNKPTPYNFDLGLLLANDPNPLELDRTNLEASLAATARDGAQALYERRFFSLLVSSPGTSQSPTS